MYCVMSRPKMNKDKRLMNTKADLKLVEQEFDKLTQSDDNFGKLGLLGYLFGYAKGMVIAKDDYSLLIVFEKGLQRFGVNKKHV